MNHNLNSQVLNMIAITKTFEQGCIMATMQDDGKTNPDEAKTLKKIKAASEKFIRELESIK